MTHFALEPIYGSVLFAIGIAVATIALIVMVTPPTEMAVHRRWLVILRSLAALAILLTVFRPALVRTDQRPAEATLVVAVDTSRSMTLPDGDGGDRWTRQKESWRELSTGIADLDDSLSVRLLAYDATSRELSDTSPQSLDETTPNGDLTDLAAATLATIQAAQGKPITGVVLMGDGTQTAPIEGTGAQRVVETLNSLGIPLWCVPIGPAGGASATRDVAIDTLPESYQLFAGNEISIDFQVATRGLAGVDVPVRVSWLRADGTAEEVGRRSVLPSKSADVAAISIPVTAPPPGTYRLKVEAETQDGELVTVNNSQVAFVDVREGGGRILYIEGAVREEQLRLRQALRRFPDLDLTYRWIPADTASSWPVDMQNWFQPGKFDVYIIGDLDAAAIGIEQLNQLTESVAAGAGLVMLGGNQTFGIGGYALSPLADVVPIDLDASLRRRVGAARNESHGQLPSPVPIRLARTHPITDLGGNDPAGIWAALPPQLGANRFVGPKVAPGVQVLLQNDRDNPLLVVGEYGKGRTAALAFDSTYRWWRAGRSDVHRRFWRQLVLWLLAREDAGTDKILIELDARRFDAASPPSFQARVQTLADNVGQTQLLAEIVNESDEAQKLAVSSDSEGDASAIRGDLPKLKPGFYRLRVKPADANSALAAEEQPFQVIDQSRELARPMADPVYLRQLAMLTSDHGGTSFEGDEIGLLVETIAERRRRAESPVLEKFRLGDGPISGWILFLLFAGSLGIEWYLRRRWGIA